MRNHPLITAFFYKLYAGRGTILMLHNVVETEDDIVHPDLEITIKNLESLIIYFKEADYDIISLDQISDYLMPKKKSKKFVIFTFDDGYKSNLTLAYPLFKKHDVPFTIYVTTSFPEKTVKLWWYALATLINSLEIVSFSYLGKNYQFLTITSDEKLQAIREISTIFYHSDDIDELIKILFTPHNIKLKDFTDNYVLTWEDIIFLDEDKLVTIACHTHNHFSLKDLSASDAKWEMVYSKSLLEEKLNHKIKYFAYPFGKIEHASWREFKLAEDVGFLTSTTNRSGNVFFKHHLHLHAMPRVNVTSYQSHENITSILGKRQTRLNKGKRIIID